MTIPWQKDPKRNRMIEKHRYVTQAEQAIRKDESRIHRHSMSTSLPPIESIGAGTDISAFMQTGVPTALRHAALRRAWTADPAIRDFMSPTENYWDAAGPDGIPGFGELDPGLDVKRMVSELFGEMAPNKAEPEQHDSAIAPPQSEENFDTMDNRSKTADPASQQSAPQQNENGATQKGTRGQAARIADTKNDPSTWRRDAGMKVAEDCSLVIA